MKKVLSFFLIMMIVISSLSVFAYESAHEAESFVNGTEYVYNLKTIGIKPYSVTSTTCEPVNNTGSINKSTMTVFKLPMPTLSDEQTIENYKFRFCTSSAGNLMTYNRVVGLDNLDWSKVEDKTMNLTQEPLASAFADYETYSAYTSSEAVLCENYADTYYYYYDITAYANECRENGQDAIYVGVFNAYTKKVYAFTDSQFAADDERIPYAYFTPGVKTVDEEDDGYVNGEEYVYNIKSTGKRTYFVSNSDCKAGGYSTNVNKTTVTVIQFPLPKLDADQTLANYKIRICDVKASEDRGSSYIYLKLDNLNWESVTSLEARLTDEPFASAVANYNNADYLASQGSTSTKCTGYDFYYYTVDVTDYANECIAKGNEVMHIGVYSRSTRSIFALTDSSFTADDERIPYAYFTPGEISPIEFVSSNVDEKKPFVNSADDAVTFTFSQAVESAAATVNGKEFECVADGNKVSVSGLDDFSKCVVSVIANDAGGNEVEGSATVYTSYFPGYDGFGYLTTPSRIINASESKTSTYNPSTSKAQVVLWKVALPEIEEGKLFESFKLRFLSPVSCGEAFDFFKLPEDLDVENLVFTSDDTPEGKINIADYANNYNCYKADTGLKFSETTDLAWSDKDNGFLEASYADFTEYANECLLGGQTHMYIGIRSNSTQAITGVGNSTLAPAGQVHYYYWKTKDADSFIYAPYFYEGYEEDAELYSQAGAMMPLSTIVKGSFCYFRTMCCNYEDTAKTYKLIIANYSTKGKLVGVKTSTVTVPANTEKIIESETIYAGVKGKIKAFIWDDTELKSAIPYATTISVVEPPLDENETPEAPIE